MEPIKTINLPEKNSSNKDLQNKKVNKKRNKNEIKVEKPILSFSFNHDSIFKKLQILLVQLLIIKTYQRLLLKNGLKFMINQEEITMLIKKLGLKHQC